MSRLESILRMRSKVAREYGELLSAVPEVIPPSPAMAGTEISWFVYVVRLQDEFTREDRDRVLELLRQDGIGCNNDFAPIHLQEFYRKEFGYRRGDFPVTEHVADRTIALPFFNHLTSAQIETVASSLARAIGSITRRAVLVPELAAAVGR